MIHLLRRRQDIAVAQASGPHLIRLTIDTSVLYFVVIVHPMMDGSCWRGLSWGPDWTLVS